MIGAQAFDEQRTIGGVQHCSKLRVQPGRHRPRRPDRPGARLDEVTDGLAKVIPVSVLHGDPRVGYSLLPHLLACVYGCTVNDLIDLADREQLPPADVLVSAPAAALSDIRQSDYRVANSQP